MSFKPHVKTEDIVVGLYKWQQNGFFIPFRFVDQPYTNSQAKCPYQLQSEHWIFLNPRPAMYEVDFFSFFLDPKHGETVRTKVVRWTLLLTVFHSKWYEKCFCKLLKIACLYSKSMSVSENSFVFFDRKLSFELHIQSVVLKGKPVNRSLGFILRIAKAFRDLQLTVILTMFL